MTYLPILVIIFQAGLVFGCGYKTWPTPEGDDVKVDNPQQVPKYYDGQMKRHVSAKGQIGIPSPKPSLKEGVPALFELADGAVIKNVVIGKKGADGIHCLGSCRIENCWWEYVGDDAATFLGKAGDTYHVSGGGAKNALNKVFQHDGGGTAIIENFQVENFAKLWLSCGNCLSNGANGPRKANINCVIAKGPGETLAGTLGNYNDSATITNVQVEGYLQDVCQVYVGNNQEKPNCCPVHETAAQDGDGKNCIYKKSDITTKPSFLGSLLSSLT
ncbi:pectate lyase domain-containing protein [Ditylenchus destructor]|uniref:Probable pectate lyase F n=1 Tax=Ditylenchus destructor TaxID=166010 RepID=A0AAD4QZW7_9BILA|nr:pectate lyase domain-containing protein [Ditylenchus destructor]